MMKKRKQLSDQYLQLENSMTVSTATAGMQRQFYGESKSLGTKMSRA